jgi:inner membrane protein involved in colicin E2 resistance
MTKRIFILIFIYVCTSIAWFILGGVTTARTNDQDMKLRSAVGQLWGTAQRQDAPTVFYQTTKDKKVTTMIGNETTVETRTEVTDHPVAIEGSTVDVSIELDHRRKGLLWYSTYRIVFKGTYRIRNTTGVRRDMYFEYRFPTIEGVYDNFTLSVDNEKVEELKPQSGVIYQDLAIAPDQEREVQVSYASQGMDEWWYIFGGGVSHIRDFTLTMTTDFPNIDFPDNSISPTEKQQVDGGWRLAWTYDDLISGIQIGMKMPQKVNPGPFVSKVTFFAPVSLFLFLFLMFIITTLSSVKVHPMNFFFICAAFFSFHLLLAYLADHADIHLALIISSIVSIFLVVSYMRLVTGSKFAFLETGLSQFVYLVLFSYTFFLTGYTGLAITILCIITLFIIMQLTGRIDWAKQFAKEKKSTS